MRDVSFQVDDMIFDGVRNTYVVINNRTKNFINQSPKDMVDVNDGFEKYDFYRLVKTKMTREKLSNKRIKRRGNR